MTKRTMGSAETVLAKQQVSSKTIIVTVQVDEKTKRKEWNYLTEAMYWEQNYEEGLIPMLRKK